jgi:hypothetical protein
MAKSTNKKKICQDLLDVARRKLSGHDGWPSAKAKLDLSSIAILSARLLLDIAPTSSLSRQYEQDLVRSHLRMLYSVHQNHETVVTGSPPEPLIAEASAMLMHARLNNNVPFMDVWQLVIQFVDEGLLPQGNVGELLGRVFSILAMDRAIEAKPTHCELTYQTPVTVLEYYKALLTGEAWEKLRNSTPANYLELSKKSATTCFEDAFKHAYFHFSHYAKAGDDTPMQDQFAWALWLRGTAVLCQLNQRLTDRALPIFFSEPSEPNRIVSGKWMSMALEQDKTSQKGDPCYAGTQRAESLGVFTQGQMLPYIAAVHSYALTDCQGLYVTGYNNREQRWCKADEAAPRYQLDFRGLGAYRGLSGERMDTIRKMIDNTKNAVFTQHPRPPTVGGVRMMLPLLNDDPYAVAWIKGLPKLGGYGSASLDDASSGLPSDAGGDARGLGGSTTPGRARKRRKRVK